MNKTLFLALVIALAANGQKIDTEKSDRSKVIRVQTLMNHLSIWELLPRLRHSLANEQQGANLRFKTPEVAESSPWGRKIGVRR